MLYLELHYVVAFVVVPEFSLRLNQLLLEGTLESQMDNDAKAQHALNVAQRIIGISRFSVELCRQAETEVTGANHAVAQNADEEKEHGCLSELLSEITATDV